MTAAGFYPAQQGVDAHGVLLLVRNRVEFNDNTGDYSGLTWLPIANVADVSSPRMTKTFHDVTPSIPGAWKQSVPGYKDPGSVTFSLLFNSMFGSHGILLKSYGSDALEEFRIVYPDRASSGDYEAVDLMANNATQWDFKGYVSSISTSHSAGGIIVGNVGLKLSGKVTTGSLSMGTEWPEFS